MAPRRFPDVIGLKNQFRQKRNLHEPTRMFSALTDEAQSSFSCVLVRPALDNVHTPGEVAPGLFHSDRNSG